MGRAALNDESKAKYRPVSNISVPIQWTKDTWSDWYLETVNKLYNIENLTHMQSSTECVYLHLIKCDVLSFIYTLLPIPVCSFTTKSLILYQDQIKSSVANFNRTSLMENIIFAGELISYKQRMF